MTRTILNTAALVAGLAGILFQLLHLPGADVLLPLGFGLLLASTLLFTARANAAAGTPAPLSYLLVATLALAILSTAFKLLHWPGVNLLGLLTLALAAASSGALLLARTAVVGSRQLLTVLLVFFTLFFGLLVLPATPAAAPATSPTAASGR